LVLVIACESTAVVLHPYLNLDPLYALGILRGLEGLLLFLWGPWRIQEPSGEKSAALHSVVLAATAAALGCALVWSWMEFAGSPFPGLPRKGWSPEAGWVLFLFTTSIASPIAEELVFRGILYRGMRSVWPAVPSVLVNSLAFACLHFLFSGQAVLPFVGSLVFCVGYEKTKHILAPVLLHVFGNLIIFTAPALLG